MRAIITLKTLLNMPNLAELAIIAGEAGIDKEIKTVATLDAPDSPKWLKGNELILTSAYIFGEDTKRIEDFVKDLIEVGASGLAFKMGRHLKQVPLEVLELANRYEFPIITIPQKFVWTDIISSFYDLKYKINNSANIIRIESSVINQIFMASKWGSNQLMMKLTELFHHPIVIATRDKQIVAENNILGTDKIIETLNGRSIFMEKKEKDIIIVDDSFLIIRPLPFSQDRRQEYIAILSPNEHFALELSELLKLVVKLSGADDSAYKGRADLYRELILGIVSGKITDDEIKNFARNRQYDNFVCSCIMIINSEEWLEIYEQFKNELLMIHTDKKKRIESYIFYDINNKEAVVLLEFFGKNDQENSNVILRELMFRLEGKIAIRTTSNVAIGGVYNSLELIKESYHQAYEAKRIGRLLWKDEAIYFYNDLSFYAMLSKLDLTKLDLRDILLLEQNKKHLSFDGIATLEAFLECGNFKKAGTKLYIHENTLRYRVQKINEMLKLNLENPLVGHSIIIKIKLWKLLKNSLS